MSDLSHDSLPKIMSGLYVSSKFKKDSFLANKDWRLTVRDVKIGESFARGRSERGWLSVWGTLSMVMMVISALSSHFLLGKHSQPCSYQLVADAKLCSSSALMGYNLE